MVKNGKSAQDIADTLDRDYSSVYAKIKSLNLPYEDHRHNRKDHRPILKDAYYTSKPPAWTKEDDDKLIKWRKEGIKNKEIAERLGRSYYAIKGREKTLGITENRRNDISKYEIKYPSVNEKLLNKYDLSGEYGIGYTRSGYKFIFDKEDYDLIKDYTWSKHEGGYLRTCYAYYIDENGKRHNLYKMMHQLIAEHYGFEGEADHKKGNTWDNRKENLRDSTHENNMKNTKEIYENNKSGVKGVLYSRNENAWKAQITYNGEHIHLGTFYNKKDAIKARLDAEKKYFGEWSRTYSEYQEVTS